MFGQEAKLAALINRDPPQVPNEQELVAELRAKLGPGADPDKLLFQIRSARGKMHWAVNSYLREVMISSVPGQEDFQPSRPARMAGAVAWPVSSSSPPSSDLARGSSSAAAAKHIDGSDAAATAGSATNGCAPAAASLAIGADANNDAGAELGHQISVGPRNPAPMLCMDQQPQQLLTDQDTAALSSGMAKDSSGSGPGLGAPSLDSLPVSLLEAVFRHLDYRSLCAAAMTSRTMSVAAASESLWSLLYASRWGRLVFPTEPRLGPTVQGGALGMGPALGLGLVMQEGSGPGRGIGPELAVKSLGLEAAPAAEGGPSAAGDCGGSVDGAFPAAPAPAAPAPAAAAPEQVAVDAGMGGETNAAGLPSLQIQWRSGLRCQWQQRQLHSLVQDPSGDLNVGGLDVPEKLHSPGSSGLMDGGRSGPGLDRARVAGSRRPLPEVQMEVSEDSFAGTSSSIATAGTGHNPSPHALSSPLPLQHKQGLQAAATVTLGMGEAAAAAAATQSRNSLLPNCVITDRDEGSTDTNVSMSRVEMASQNASATLPSTCPAVAPAVAVVITETSVATSESQALPAACVNRSGGDCGSGGGRAPAIQISDRCAHDTVDEPTASHADTRGNGGKDMLSTRAVAPAYSSAATAVCDKAVANAPSKAMTVAGLGDGKSDVNGPLAGTSSKAAAFSASTMGERESSEFRLLYRQQISYLNTLRCPRCGGGSIVPIVYGFPSPKLMDGMRERRLILGGDHLIENCHVWGCNRCGASFRHFPYDRCESWISELARPQPQRPSHLPHYTYEL